MRVCWAKAHQRSAGGGVPDVSRVAQDRATCRAASAFRTPRPPSAAETTRLGARVASPLADARGTDSGYAAVPGSTGRPGNPGWLVAVGIAGSALAVGSVHTVTLCLVTGVFAVAAVLGW